MMLVSEGGFGVVTVMVGAVVLGILALTLTQKAQNRAEVSLIADIMAYRDQVLEYYTSLASTRSSWQCTMRGTPDLEGYVRWGTGTNLEAWRDYDTRDGDGNCELPNPGGGTGGTGGTVRIPETGLGLDTFDPLPTTPATVVGTASGCDGKHFCVKSQWKGAGSSTGATPHGGVGRANPVEVKISVAFQPDEHSLTSVNLKTKEKFIYMNRTAAKSCADGLAANLGYYDDAGTGLGARRFLGDTAVVGINSTTRLVTCSEKGPLVVPPCYQFPVGDDDNVFVHTGTLFNAAGACDCHRGLCPKVGTHGITGISHFDKQTGVAHCGKEHVLLKTPINNKCSGYSPSSRDAVMGIDGAGDVVCASARGVTAVKPQTCSGSQYIIGFDSSGNIICSGSSSRHPNPPFSGRQGPPGVVGAQGDQGQPVSCSHRRC